MFIFQREYRHLVKAFSDNLISSIYLLNINLTRVRQLKYYKINIKIESLRSTSKKKVKPRQKIDESDNKAFDYNNIQFSLFFLIPFHQKYQPSIVK